MSYLVDVVFVVREIILLSFMVVTSPFGIVGGLLLLDRTNI